MISVVNLKFCIVGYCNCKSEGQVRDIIIRLKNKPFRENQLAMFLKRMIGLAKNWPCCTTRVQTIGYTQEPEG